MKRASEVMWAIQGRSSGGRPYLYPNISMRRKDMIADHVAFVGMSWEECQLRGDRVVRVTITWVVRNAGGRP